MMAANFSSTPQQNLNSGHSLQGDNKTDVSDKQTLLAVLQFLKKNNLKGTEELLKREACISEADVKQETTTPSESDVSHALAAYKSEDDPTLYNDNYTDFRMFIESCLDVHRITAKFSGVRKFRNFTVELSVILYPVFIHMYLELVYNGHEQHAKEFFQKFSVNQEDYYQDDLTKLATVTKQEHMKGNQLMENFKSSKFVLKMSRDSYTHLKRHLQEKRLSLLLNIIQEHLFIDVFDGVPRNKQQVTASIGSIMGEAAREANRTKVYYGLLKEPDLNIPMEEEEEQPEGDGDKPKKKKQKKDPLLMKKSRNDPNSPALTRIPLPELKDADKMDKITSFREALKRVKFGPETLPSICFYTLMNAFQGVTCIDIAEDSSLMACGFGDSNLRVWTLTPNKLRAVKQLDELELIDKDADDVLERMMDNRTAEDCKLLLGHTGPVYGASFSNDRNYLTSSSEDGTVRLWSLQTWTNLVCYKGHNDPVWDVKFSPQGHYFVSVGRDRLARLWTTDHYQPVRMFAGHLSDIDYMNLFFNPKAQHTGKGPSYGSLDAFECCQFHPNGNYVATGSSDRMIRLYDILNGSCVRVLTGHKGSVHCLAFSPDGHYLASSGIDGSVVLWDIANGNMVAQMNSHTHTVYSLCFSRCGTILASGGLDNYVKLWDITKIMKELDKEMDASIPSSLILNDSPSLLLGTFPTKSTPVLALHFTRKNLLLASGPLKTS